VGGIGLDLFTFGQGGRAVNSLQALKGAATILDVVSMSYSTGASMRDLSVSQAEVVDTILAAAGVTVPVFPDLASLIWNLSGGVEFVP
jgi:hypothetical protein